MKDFYWQKENGNKKGILCKKKWVGYCKVTFLQGMAGVYQEDYLSTADQVISDWFKIPFLQQANSNLILVW